MCFIISLLNIEVSAMAYVSSKEGNSDFPWFEAPTVKY